jgi:hypothetical protein
MKRRIHCSAIALSLAVPLASCDSVDVGDNRTEGTFGIARVMVQDGTRYVATDLLNTKELRSCSLTDPCPAEMQVACTETEAGKTGVCPDPLSLRVTPPPLAEVTDPSTFMVRVVFNRILKLDDVEVDDPLSTTTPKARVLKDPSVVQLIGPDGTEIAARKWYDAQGDHVQTSNPIDFPYGPALVIVPDAALAPEFTYTLRVKPELLKSTEDEALPADQGTYTFKVEPLYPTAAAPDGDTVFGDAISYTINGVLTATNTVTSGLVTRAGAAVRVRICSSAEEPWVLHVVPVDASNQPTAWPLGDYSANLGSFTSADNPLATIKSGALAADGILAFTVTATTEDTPEPTNPIEDALATCE